MTIASGVAGQIRALKQSGLGTMATATSTLAKQYNRRECTVDLTKSNYESQDIVTTYQVGDMRHGARRVEGNLTAELAPGGHAQFIQSGLRRDFAAITASTAVSVTVGTGTTLGGVQLYTVVRAAGNWVTDGYKAGMVGRLSVGTLNAANINKNLFILSLTTGTMVVMPGNGAAMVGEGPIAGCTFTASGKYTYAPPTNQTNDYITFERWFPDVSISRTYGDCKVNSLAFQLPPSGMAGLTIGLIGRDIQAGTGTAQYFTAAQAAPTTGRLAAVNGAVLVGGTPQGVITGLDFTLDGGMDTGQVVGANVSPDVFVGRIRVSGNIKAYFQDATFLDAFTNETEMGLAFAFYTGNTANADFMAFQLPRVKFSGAQVDDGEKGLEISAPFTALYNGSGGSGQTSEQTTLAVQDSQAP